MKTVSISYDFAWEMMAYEGRVELRREDLEAEFREAMDECPECNDDAGEIAAEMDAYFAGEGN